MPEETLDEVKLGGDQGVSVRGWSYKVKNANHDKVEQNGNGAFTNDNPRTSSNQELKDANFKELNVTVTIGGNVIDLPPASRTLASGKAFTKAGWHVKADGTIHDADTVAREAETPGMV